MKDKYENKIFEKVTKKVKPTYGHTFDFPPHDISFRADSLEEATAMFIEWKKNKDNQGRGNIIKKSEVNDD